MPSRPLIWLAILLLAMGVAALLAVGTIWSVPMALLISDPRMVGTVLVGLGLLVAGAAWHRASRERRRAASLIPALAVVSVVTVAWTHLAAPYTVEDVDFANLPASLSGTLLLPGGAGPHSAIVFLHGSGPEQRAITYQFAEPYVRAGIAALIYDKRGSGASVGGHPRDPYSDLAEDAIAAVRLLRDHPGIDPDRIGLWGLSEGGWTAPLAASLAPDEVSFLVIVSGGGASTEDEDLYSIQTQLEDAGIGAEGIGRALELRRRINAYYRTGEDRAAVLTDVARAHGTGWFRAAGGYLPRAHEVYVHGSDEWRTHMTFLDFDALPLLRELDIPMLFVHGELDRSYPAALSAARLTELAADPARDLTVVTHAGADHSMLVGMFPWPRYADGFREGMIGWVVERFGPGR